MTRRSLVRAATTGRLVSSARFLAAFVWCLLSLVPQARAQAPSSVTLNQPSTYYTSVNLSWSQSPEPNFTSYKVYRRTSAGVTAANGTLVATITTVSSTSTFDLRPQRTRDARPRHHLLLCGSSGGQPGPDFNQQRAVHLNGGWGIRNAHALTYILAAELPNSHTLSYIPTVGLSHTDAVVPNIQRLRGRLDPQPGRGEGRRLRPRRGLQR